MITKSMSRKSSSFKQLLNYLDKEDVLDRFCWNMYSNRNSNKDLVKEFMENAKSLKQSRGSVYLYHEVISLDTNSLDSQKSRGILYELANEYVNNRAKNQMVFASIHNDTNNPHIHLVISSNEVSSNRRVRLSKKEFAQIQANLEAYKNTHFKELKQTHIYQQSNSKSKTKRSEQEIKHKRKTATKKEQICEDLQNIFSKTTNSKFLENALASKGYEIYTRGSTTGVIFEGKKYRLKTLGLEQEYKQTLTKIKSREKTKEKRQEFKRTNSKTNDRTHTR